jgi:hypothetical protein
MKKFTLFILALLFITLNSSAQNQQIIVGKNYVNPNEVTLVAERGTSTTIKFDLNELNLIEIETDYGLANKIMSANATIMLEAGSPELFYLPTALIIPDVGSAELDINYGEYTEYKNIEIAPSKGNLSRSIDPETVPYLKGEVYNQNAFFPGTLATLNEPFIMRDVRGQTLFVYPVQYNPVTKTLRIYSEITVTVNYNEEQGENELTNQKRHNTVDPAFNQMYGNMFINYNNLSRGYPTGEEGELLIICHTAWVDNMKPYVDWKRTIGRKTTIVPTSAITPSLTVANIKTYITNYYNNPANDLAYVLLVGDSPQVPTQTHNRPSATPTTLYSDHFYGQLVGTDPYLEVLVGRFSAESVTDVETQVQRAIHYERNLTTADTWLSVGIGLAQRECGGHFGECDDQHIEAIRGRLLNYGYTTVHQEYRGVTGIPNTTVAQVSLRFNNGAGVANYCNHGSITSWGFGITFDNSHVNALQNAGKLPFIFSVACLNGRFVGNTCFSEAWMRARQNNQPTGAIAFFGATVNLNWIPPMAAQDIFANIMLDLPLPYTYGNNGPQPGIKRTIAGAMLNATQMMMMVHGSNVGNLARDDFDSWLVFFFFFLNYRTKTPQAMAVTHNSEIPSTANSLFVTCVSGALAALSYIDGSNNVVILGTAVAGTDNIAVINFTLPATPPANVKLAVTGFNKVTYLADIQVSTFQPQFCEKPVGLDGIANGKNAIITWSQPEPIDGTLLGYNVYRDDEKIGETPPSVKMYKDNNLANGIYIYKVSARYEHCPESELTAGKTVVIFVPQFCEPPVELTSIIEENNVLLTWNEPVIDGTLIGYNIYRDEEKIAETLPSVKQYLDEELANGTYVYQVSAGYEHCGESELTAGKTVVVFVPQFCEKPISVAVEPFDCGVTVSWDEPENIDGTLLFYRLYMDGILTTTSEYPYTSIIHVITLNPGYSTYNATHIFQVNAVYEHCVSELTDEVTVDIICGPQLCEKPVELSGMAEENTAVINWREPENIDGTLLGYNIYRDEIKINAELVEELEYRDKDLADGTYVYQIFAKYEHCESELTDDVSITIITEAINEFHADSFNIYPNPATNELQVTSDKLQVTSVEVFDVMGRNLLSSPVTRHSSLVTIDVSHFPAGIYFVKIYTEEKQIVTKKLVVLR